jgi:hypothetical protein
VVGDRVQELRPHAGSERALQLVDVQPVVVHRHRDDLRLEAAEGHDRAEVRRGFDDDEVAAVEERLRDELEALDCTARDQKLGVFRAPSLRRLEPPGERVEGTREPARRCVLERVRPRRTRRTRPSSADARSRGNVAGSGKPPANEIRSGRPSSERMAAIASPTSARVRSAKSSSQLRTSGAVAMDRL